MPDAPGCSVLFVCVHNSARSQMAEAFANGLGRGRVAAYSAGLEPGRLNPLVVEAMAELGYDISRNATKSVHDPRIAARSYDYVITVCDAANAERCPVFAGGGVRLHWGFEDPPAHGDRDAALERIRRIRDKIRAKVAEWCRVPRAG